MNKFSMCETSVQEPLSLGVDGEPLERRRLCLRLPSQHLACSFRSTQEVGLKAACRICNPKEFRGKSQWKMDAGHSPELISFRLANHLWKGEPQPYTVLRRFMVLFAYRFPVLQEKARMEADGLGIFTLKLNWRCWMIPASVVARQRPQLA